EEIEDSSEDSDADYVPDSDTDTDEEPLVIEAASKSVITKTSQGCSKTPIDGIEKFESVSKLARHLKTHIKDDGEIAKALSLPVGSKTRKELLEKLRNKGNFMHNIKVQKNGSGSLKVKRKPKEGGKTYDYCMHCQAMFLDHELWRHMRRCSANPDEDLTDEEENSEEMTVETSLEEAAPELDVSTRRRHIPKRRTWRKAEVQAVMRHFKAHIQKGQLASVKDCETCKSSEHPALQNRTVQNIRDFVRNRGLRCKH
ncbi:hypothetical protein DNTS_008981, partial [Danionella cerebrum]